MCPSLPVTPIWYINGHNVCPGTKGEEILQNIDR